MTALDQPQPQVKLELNGKPPIVKKESIGVKTETPENVYTEYKLKCCTKDEIKNIRHHVLKFHSRVPVDPVESFKKPIHLHRKDPRGLQFQLSQKDIDERRGNAAAAEAEGTNDTEQTDERPETDMSVVAPDGGARTSKRNLFKKRTRQINAVNEASKKLQYEEAYPWVLEDYDATNTWVGSFEATSSDAYVLFVFDDDGFKMVPAEKVYKFTPRKKYATLTLEEAEAKMEKKSQVPRWLMKKRESENENEYLSGRAVGVRQRFRTVDGSSGKASRGGGEYLDDREEFDFDEEFADDEEAPLMDAPEEDNKELEKRLKREMNQANNIGEPVDNAVDDSLFEDAADERKMDKEGKKLKKYLMALEKNFAYDSDEEENPYISEEDLEESSDEENKVKSEDKKAEDKKDDKKQSTSRKSSPSSNQRRVHVKQVSNLPKGMVIIKAPASILGKLPKGDWNPTARKRTVSVVSPNPSEVKVKTSKRQKISGPVTAQTNGTSSSPELGHNPNILVGHDVKAALSAGPLTVKELIAKLKQKLVKDPSNKDRFKGLVKKYAKFQHEKLYLKE